MEPFESSTWQQPYPEPKKSAWKRLRARIASLLAVLVASGKWILLLLPKAKVLLTCVTMVVSIAAYSLFWGWTFALGFVLLLFVHEMGHVVQLRREGVAASAPVFIPFLGAAVAMREMPENAAAEARVGLAGPIAGALATLVPVIIWRITGSAFWQELAYVGFFLNLFNLLPVLPLDGGRAMSAVSTWMWLIGFAALVVLAVFEHTPIFFIILVLGGLELLHRWRARKTPESQRFHKVPRRTRLLVGLTYLLLVGALAFGTHATYTPMSITQATQGTGS